MVFNFNPNSNMYCVLSRNTNTSSMQTYSTSFTRGLVVQKTNEIKFGQLSGVSVCFMSHSEPSSTCEHTPLICYTLSHQPKHSHTAGTQSQVAVKSSVTEQDCRVKVCQETCIFTRYVKISYPQ